MTRDQLEGYEIRALCLLATRTQKQNIVSWFMPIVPADLNVNYKCLVCNELVTPNLYIIVEHGREHIKERNLTMFL